jgi:adenosine deaminase
MTKTSIAPLGIIPADPHIAALPKAELHVHQEWSPRLDRVLSRRAGRPSYNWHDWATQLMAETAPGMPRLGALSTIFPAPVEDDALDENFIARVEDLLEEAAVDGAVLVELKFGGETVLRPGFMALFREAERRVQARHPRLRAEASYALILWYEPERLERVVQACIRAADEGLGGIDLLYNPYDAEADWTTAYRIAERAAEAGMGITAHAGEFSSANIAAALRVPGLTRLGHAVYAASDPHLLELTAQKGVTIECCLSCNVVLGAVRSYEEHPIQQFVAYGIPVALGTDNPVQMTTTIGREYAAAHTMGFSEAQLLTFTRNAVRAAFTTPARRDELLAELDKRR